MKVIREFEEAVEAVYVTRGHHVNTVITLIHINVVDIIVVERERLCTLRQS